ncbi:hypothetical protein UFOVP421_8 [uncultured Caudovirales phage]|uniref:Uncharacterized protein n=1 Tax=uncultured Caudovirales phage TaxID=2100421 RepID=A0A6J5M955_9CAUD|nr:hypothetical protein UFOVP421_8 [uncultured Caudovirales phage]
MTPHNIIRRVLERGHDFIEADQGAQEILERLAAQGFVVVHAKAVIQQDGKVSVTRLLVESVLEDAATWVKANYIVGDGPHPAMAHKFRRDMADILALRAELQEARDA